MGGSNTVCKDLVKSNRQPGRSCLWPLGHHWISWACFPTWHKQGITYYGDLQGSALLFQQLTMTWANPEVPSAALIKYPRDKEEVSQRTCPTKLICSS